METFIVQLNDYFLEWSSITDSPITFGMKLDEFKEYYKEQYGQVGIERLDERLARVERYGNSSHMYHSNSDLLSGNRAGENEKTLTIDGIYRVYCLRETLDGLTVPVSNEG